MITVEFLESKRFSMKSGWNGNFEDCIRASNGNIEQISDNVFSFTEYNFLPCDGSELDGHYTFFVNIKTFDYLAYQSSYFGSFTYTTPSKNTQWVKLNEIDTKIVEAKIANKLLKSYFYDRKHINQRGKHLIEDGKNDWGKHALITDYRGYVWVELKVQKRDKKELEALNLIDKEFKVEKIKNIKVVSVLQKEIIIHDNIRFGWNLIYKVNVKTNKRNHDVFIQRYCSFGSMYNTTIKIEDKQYMGFSGCKRFSQVLSLLPEFYKSL